MSSPDYSDIRPELQRAVQLATAGQRVEATYLLRSVLRRDPYLLIAWRWLAYCTPDREERLRALGYLLRVDPDDAWARQMWASQVVASTQPITVTTARPIQRSSPAGILPLWLTAIALLIAAVVIVLGTGVRLWTTIRASSGGEFPLLEVEVTPPPPVQPAPQVVVNSTTDYYTFQATTIREIQTHLNTQGPNVLGGEHSIAVTSYEFQVSWDWLQTGATCVVDDVEVLLNLDYTYPRWEPVGSPLPMVYDEWDRFIQHVIAHEETHGQIALGCANEIAAQIGALPAMAACGDLETALNGVIEQVYQTCAERQEAYDAVEGRTSFPLP